jgi:DNA primase large subunit
MIFGTINKKLYVNSKFITSVNNLVLENIYTETFNGEVYITIDQAIDYISKRKRESLEDMENILRELHNVKKEYNG